MITSIQIQNFKSVVDLKLELGRFNVLIGANGCGKSNILEAIAFAAAANADKLDYEFLGSRGIRLTRPEFMFSAFEDIDANDKISVQFSEEGKSNLPIALYLDPDNQKRWINGRDYLFDSLLLEMLSKQMQMRKFSSEQIDQMELLKKSLAEGVKGKVYQELKSITITSSSLSNYLLYCPEESSLRRFDSSDRLYPLGIRGEGLFQHLKELTEREDGIEILNEIKENLMMLDWFDDIQVPENLLSTEYSLQIRDRYLKETLHFFDQRSTNEGFLFLLFYLTLFISNETPSFFAIDNLESSFNPKMCRELTLRLAELARKHNKQVIVTTHNPAMLDGLNIANDDERLFVVSRNDDGHTRARRIPYNEERRMKLSEIWTSGYIGGLPDNF